MLIIYMVLFDRVIILSYTLRCVNLFNQYNAIANENHTLAKYILLYAGVNKGAINSIPMITPITPPIVQYISELYSNLIFIYNIANVADDIPMDCIKKAKLIASDGDTFKASVSTGNATAAPPSHVAPAIILAAALVIDIK